MQDIRECPICGGSFLVKDSRVGGLLPVSYIRRTLQCTDCGRRFGSVELLVGEMDRHESNSLKRDRIRTALYHALGHDDYYEDFASSLVDRWFPDSPFRDCYIRDIINMLSK